MNTPMDPWQEYRDNEDCNAHSDNLALMARHVGSSTDVAQAEIVRYLVSRNGCMTPRAESIYGPLQEKLWPLFRDQFRKN